MRRMEADVFPAYGHKSINEVTAADVRQLMIAVEKRDARDVAKRIHETTSQIFRFAIARDIATRNPAADFKPRDILGRGPDGEPCSRGCEGVAGTTREDRRLQRGRNHPTCDEAHDIHVCTHERRNRSALDRVRSGRGTLDHPGRENEDEDSSHRSAIPSSCGCLKGAQADHRQRSRLSSLALATRKSR